MRDEEDVLVVWRQVLEALPDPLGTRSGVLETVWGVIPFFVTGREIEQGKLSRYIGARDSFVAHGIVGFAQVRPDLELDPGGRAVEKRAEGDKSRLDSARHGGHEDEVRLGWQMHVACLLKSEFCQRGVSMGVTPVNAAGGMSN